MTNTPTVYAETIDAGLRVLHDNARTACPGLVAALADSTTSPADRALLLLNTNVSPAFRLDYASLSPRDAFALRNALVIASNLLNRP